jgi:uncharacterized membrane protein
MKIKVSHLLILINVISILLFLCIYFSFDVMRIVLGLPFILFFPGYTLMLVLFPRREQIGGIERIALSFGLSIAIVPLIGLIFNYTPWGITLDSMLYALTSFILVMSIIGWVRTRNLPDDEKPRIELHFRRGPSSANTWDKTLSVILVIAILGAIGVAGYLIIKPKVGDTYTEFYLLGENGTLENYPQQLTLGEAGKVTVGIINHENKQLNYRVKVLIDNQENEETGPVLLVDGEKWEGEMTFTPKVSSDNQEVEFQLFKGDDLVTPANSLHLWINVKDKVK